MRTLLLFTIATLIAVQLHAQSDPLPYHPSQAGYHDANVALAEYCLENQLFSEARLLCESVTGTSAERAREIIAECEDKSDTYTSETWGGYLERREAVQQRRAIGADKAGYAPKQVLQIDPDNKVAREKLGQKWLDGMGWLSATEFERLSPLVLKPGENPEKPDRAVSWEAPYVLVGEHFTLVTDLPWKRALKYSGYLDRFHDVFLELLGDVIPDNMQPNVVWCCAKSETFVNFTKSVGFEMSESNAGMHVGMLQSVFINAERSDYVGRKNKSWDNLARTMFHECAHRLVEVGLRGRRSGWDSYELASTPEHAWIVESIAIVFEDLQITKSGYKLKGLEDQRTFTIGKYWKGAKGAVPALRPVLMQGYTAFAESTPISSAEKYALAGSVAWYCLFEAKEHRTAYLTLLVDYYRTDTTRRDFDKRFGVSLAEFETAWKAWVAK